MMSARNQRQSDAVAQSRSTLRYLGEAVANLVDAETGQRGFLITRDTAYLHPFASGVSLYQLSVDSLRILLADSPWQRARLDSIAELARQKLLELNYTLDVARGGDRPTALATVRTNAGARLMDEIRRHADAIRSREIVTLRQGETRGARLNTLTLVLIAFSAALGVALTLRLGMILSRAVGEQEALTAELQDKARLLEETASELEISKEELECSYEELQAGNEELQAANDELHETNTRLDAANTQLESSRVALAESDRRHRAVLRAADAVVWTTDPAGRFVEPQPEWLSFTGQQADESLGFGWVTMLHPDDRDAIAANWGEAVRQGQLYATSGRLWHAESGAYRFFNVIAAPVKNEQGETSEWFGVIFDVNDRKMAEEALREESERRLLAVTTAGLGTFVRELGSEMVVCDEPLLRLMGIPDARSSVPSSELEGLIHPDDREQVVTSAQQAIEADREFVIEFRLKAPEGGSARWLTARGRIARDAAGRPARVYGVVGDVTERRQIEAQLQQVEKLGAIGRLAGGVAHEVNNALTAGIGFCHFALQSLEDSDPARADLEQVLRANERAAVIAQQLLAFTRRQILRPQSFDPAFVLNDLEPMMRRLLGSDFELQIDCAHEGSDVHMDRGQLEQVLVNLVINARDALSVGGRVRIETARVILPESQGSLHQVPPGDYVRLTVSDDGHGMSPSVRQRAFEPFFTTKPVGKGTGLGLSTVHGIVHQSGGEVVLESAPNEGTSVSIFLPAQAPSDAPISVADPAARGTETILVVEDEPQVRQLAIRILESFGYAVESAADGLEALALLARLGRSIPLVVTDVVMPAMNGHELAARIRTEHPHVRLLFMSGYAGEDVMARGLIEPDDPFLQKPFSPDSLARAVRAELDRAEPVRG